MRGAVTGAVLLAAGLAAGCSRHTLRGADRQVGVRLPRDHAAHADAQTEWWHVHGHLADEEGRRYDFFLGFVRQHTDEDRLAFLPLRWLSDPVQVALFTLTDRAAGTFDQRDKVAWPDVWAAGADGDVLDLHHDSWWLVARPEGGMTLRAATGRSELQVVLEGGKPPARMGDDGYLHVPPDSSHYYYSLPRLDARGTVTIDGQERAVQGRAWFKHEWGFLYSDAYAGWLWLGLQLSNGKEVVVALIYDRQWNLAEGSFAVVVEPGGVVHPVGLTAVEVVDAGETWRSPQTRTAYPTRWIVRIPEREAWFVLQTPVPGQELMALPANLWAGALEVRGTIDGDEVTGDAFVELLGLDEPFGRSLFVSGRHAQADGEETGATAP